MSKFPRLSEIVRRLGGSPKKDDCTPVIDWTKIEEREPPSLPHDVNDITSKMSRSYEHAADEGHFYISEIETATKDNNEYYKISGWINKHNPCVPGHSRASYSGISCEYILEFKLVDGASRLSRVVEKKTFPRGLDNKWTSSTAEEDYSYDVDQAERQDAFQILQRYLAENSGADQRIQEIGIVKPGHVWFQFKPGEIKECRRVVRSGHVSYDGSIRQRTFIELLVENDSEPVYRYNHVKIRVDPTSTSLKPKQTIDLLQPIHR